MSKINTPKTSWMSKLLPIGILIFGVASASVALFGGTPTPKSNDAFPKAVIGTTASTEKTAPATVNQTPVVSHTPSPVAIVNSSIPPASNANVLSVKAATPPATFQKKTVLSSGSNTEPSIKSESTKIVVESSTSKQTTNAKADDTLTASKNEKSDKVEKTDIPSPVFKLKPLDFSLETPSVVLASEEKAWIRMDSKNTQIFKKGQAVPGLGTYLGPDKKGAKFDTGIVPITTD